MKFVLLSAIIFFRCASAETVFREQLSELHKIRSEIKSAVFDQARYQQDILKGQLDLESQNQEISRNQHEANEIKEKILDRISTLYKIRRAYPNGTFLSFVNEEDFLRKSYYLNYLNNQDKNLMADYKSKTEITKKLKNKVQAYTKHLVELQKLNEIKFSELRLREDRQRELIRSIKQVVRLQKSDEKVELMNDKNFFSELRGKLELPLKGEIRGSLGIHREIKTKLALLKTGLNISSKSGTEVHSVSDGEVLHVEEIAGWGPTIVIDHGESYYSVYSHLKNLSVRPGDRVITQQKLAEVSSVPYYNHDSDQGLYFEIRHYSEPEDPRLWFKGEQ